MYPALNFTPSLNDPLTAKLHQLVIQPVDFNIASMERAIAIAHFLGEGFKQTATATSSSSTDQEAVAAATEVPKCPFLTAGDIRTMYKLTHLNLCIAIVHKNDGFVDLAKARARFRGPIKVRCLWLCYNTYCYLLTIYCISYHVHCPWGIISPIFVPKSIKEMLKL